MSDRRINKGFVRARTPDPLSLESLIGWLETMPAEGEYKWGSCDCMYAQYAYDHGFGADPIDAYVNYIVAHNGGGEPFDGLAFKPPHTFGAALERARALSASMKTDAA